MTDHASDTTRAATIVADWLTGLWVSRPTWLNRMPDKEHVDQLVSAIAANIPNRAATALLLDEAVKEFLAAEDAVEAEARRAEQPGANAWSSAPVVRRSYAVAKLRELLAAPCSPDCGDDDRLRERCLAYKGQVEAGSIAIQHLQGEINRLLAADPPRERECSFVEETCNCGRVWRGKPGSNPAAACPDCGENMAAEHKFRRDNHHP
jgi:hypothetical protein